ncbi:MAG: hypothetical protein AAGJ83_08465 [Planctomycetota bacterium]
MRLEPQHPSIIDHREHIESMDDLFLDAKTDDVEISKELEEFEFENLQDVHQQLGVMSSIVARIFTHGKV